MSPSDPFAVLGAPRTIPQDRIARSSRGQRSRERFPPAVGVWRRPFQHVTDADLSLAKISVMYRLSPSIPRLRVTLMITVCVEPTGSGSA